LAQNVASAQLIGFRPEQREQRVATHETVGQGEVGEQSESLWLQQNRRSAGTVVGQQVDGTECLQLDHESTLRENPLIPD
jgi:hypothetical protein